MEDVKDGRDYNFPNEELRILQLWDDIDAFQEQLRRSEGKTPYVFYDGPPFATGLPHYGHLLAGTLKVGCCQEIVECFHCSCRLCAKTNLDRTSCAFCESLQYLICRTWLPDMPRQQATTAPGALGESSTACMHLGAPGRFVV